VTGVSADHPSVRTPCAHLERYGPVCDCSRPPRRATPSRPAPVRVVLAGTVRHARSREATDGAPFPPGAYDTPDLTRDPSRAADRATDRLAEWAATRGLDADAPVLADVLSVGERNGLRDPGESVTDRERRQRDDGLAAIARDLDG